MALHLVENQYAGINAHLHSYFQQVEGWPGFHTLHISDLFDAFQAALPFASGYTIDTERSIQVVHFDEVRRYRPDIGVYRQDDVTTGVSGTASAPTLVLPLSLSTIEPDEIGNVKIYKLEDDSERLVTQVELLSPANKPGGAGWVDYRRKRDEVLSSGVVLVEIDYLHERKAVIVGMPDYPAGEASSYPYAITVSRIITAPGQAWVYAWRVDEPLPTIAIPLENDDAVTIDFNAAYQRTFSRNQRYAQLYVDYENPPRNPDAYDKIDQERIQAVMTRATEQR